MDMNEYQYPLVVFYEDEKVRIDLFKKIFFFVGIFLVFLGILTLSFSLLKAGNISQYLSSLLPLIVGFIVIVLSLIKT